MCRPFPHALGLPRSGVFATTEDLAGLWAAIQCAHQTLTNRLIALLGPVVVGCRSGGDAGGGLLLAGLLAAIAETARRPGHFTEAAAAIAVLLERAATLAASVTATVPGNEIDELLVSAALGILGHRFAPTLETAHTQSPATAASDESTLVLDYSSERGSDETDDEMGVGGPLAAASTASASVCEHEALPPPPPPPLLGVDVADVLLPQWGHAGDKGRTAAALGTLEQVEASLALLLSRRPALLGTTINQVSMARGLVPSRVVV